MMLSVYFIHTHMSKWDTPASSEIVHMTIQNLKKHNIDAILTQTEEEAKAKVLEMIPAGASVLTMTSQTLELTGIATAIQDSGKYDSIRKKLLSMDRETQRGEMQQIGAAPEWAIGSVHAVTHDGTLLIASKTGSQLSAYAYGSAHVIWVIGTQKIVTDMNEGFERINSYALELESKRAMKAYGMGSSVDKVLVIHEEVMPGRDTVIFINKNIGF